MGTQMTILSNKEKEEVIQHVLLWQRTNRLKSTRKFKDNIPKTVITIVVQLISRIDKMDTGSEEKKTLFFNYISKLPSRELITNRNTLEDLKQLIDVIVNDEKLKGFSYEQLSFFIHWMQRITK